MGGLEGDGGGAQGEGTRLVPREERRPFRGATSRQVPGPVRPEDQALQARASDARRTAAATDRASPSLSSG